ncbi:hypothetical protein [Methylobacterium nodulans]|uniref:hypothetical protein n=1 Tax=Methylobacterium nodulans TaxID=114616 RepID=UPI0002F32BEE|nr:hypothetical protein [Methylobacterium nodulans]
MTTITEEDRKRLHHLRIDLGLTLQELGVQAWSLLLAKHRLPPLQEVRRPNARPVARRRRPK